MNLDFVTWDPHDATHPAALAQLWNDACGDEFPLNEKFVRYNTLPSINAIQTGQSARVNDEWAGCVLVTASSQFKMCWIDALVVSPQSQRRGIGSALLQWAEEWGRAQGILPMRLGGGLRPFVSGLPNGLNTRSFFETRGYRITRSVYDVARSLSNYESRAVLDPSFTLRAANESDANALAHFLGDFSERWQYEFLQAQHDDEPITEYLLLLTKHELAGFARVTLEYSARPIERFYPRPLPGPWGQVGPLGVAQHVRGKGYGAILIDGALQHLRSLGVDGCVIDWTDLLDLYAKFGFTRYHEFLIMVKDLT